jgi:hypothetical protein
MCPHPSVKVYWRHEEEHPSFAKLQAIHTSFFVALTFSRKDSDLLFGIDKIAIIINFTQLEVAITSNTQSGILRFHLTLTSYITFTPKKDLSEEDLKQNENKIIIIDLQKLHLPFAKYLTNLSFLSVKKKSF